jgi:hypothetical protein
VLKNQSYENGTDGHGCQAYRPNGVFYEERGEVDKPKDWTLYYLHDPDFVPPWDTANQDGWCEPEVKPIPKAAPFLDPLRISDGQWAMKAFTMWRIHTLGFSQQVACETGKRYQATVYAHAWSSNDDDAHTSDGIGSGPFFALEGTAGLSDAQQNFVFKVGIDPTGGTNPFADTVIWGQGAHVYNAMHQLPIVEVIAQADRVTVFVQSVCRYRLKHNDAYFDNWLFEEVDVPEPPQPEPGLPYQVIVELLPPDATLEEKDVVTRVVHAEKRTFMQSADDAWFLVTHGAEGSAVHVWERYRWTDDIEAYLRGHGVENIEFFWFGEEPSPPPTTGKLGPHIMRNTADIALTYPAPVVKLVGDWGLAGNYGGLVIGRYAVEYAVQGDYIQGKTPRQSALDFVVTQTDTIVANPLIEYWEGPNEPVFTTMEGLAWYAQFEIERMNLMEALGKKCVLGNFATGTPELSWWPAFLPAIEYGIANGAILGLHEYSCPWIWWMTGDHQIDPSEDEGDEGWTTLRYRKVYRQYLEPAGLGEMPLVITEAGIDPGVNPRPPGTPAGTWKQLGDFWRDNDGRPDTARHYFDQLRWYEEELKKDSYVIGATVFTWGSSGPPWDAFDVAQTEVAQLLGAHWSATPPPEPPEPEPEIVILDVRDQLATNPASPWYPWRRRTLDEITHFFVHHSAGAPSSSLDTVKAIARAHTSPTGKFRPGICYTFVIGADGTVWYVSDIENVVFSQGSETYPGDENRFGMGCCLLGNFTAGREPTAEQMQALEALIAFIESDLGRPLKVWGHKDVAPTQCPGDSWPWKPEWGRHATQPPTVDFVVGVHSAPVPFPTISIDALVRRLQSLRISEYKLLDDGNPANVDLVHSLSQNGIMPVVRMFQQGQFPGRLASALMDRARVLYNAGARLFEIGNEPNLTGEWQCDAYPSAGWQDTAMVQQVAANWWADAVEMIGWGGKPAFYAMAPTERGGVNQPYSSVMWARKMLDWIGTNHRQQMTQFLQEGKVWLAVHTSPFTRPFDYSPVQPWGTDDMCLLGYEPLQAYIRQLFGVTPVTISTEGGVYSPAHMEELGWPDAPYTWETWGDYTWAMHNFLAQRGTLNGMHTWVLSDEGSPWWPNCGWYDQYGNPRTPIATRL